MNFGNKLIGNQRRFLFAQIVDILETKQKTVEGTNSRRGSSFFYFLRINGKKVPICQSIYLSTLGLKNLRSDIGFKITKVLTFPL